MLNMLSATHVAGQAASTVERSLKGALRVVSAVNQSRLKVVLDPIYERAAALMLRNVPVSPALCDDSFEENAFFKYDEAHRKTRYSVHDWDFRDARPELLTDRERRILHSFATGETSGFAVGAGFLRAFRNDPELGSFFGVWFTEELNHYWGFHHYVARMGEAWSLDRKRDVTGVDFLDYADDALEVAAANMYQELIAYLVYRSFGKQTRDPFLAKMMATFAKDELRHYKFYERVVARAIQRDPGFRVVALKHFLKATTPMNQVSGGARNVVEHLSQASFYFRKPEFDFMLKQNAYLFGATFESAFTLFYRRHVEPCTTCAREVFQCDCASFA